MPQFDANHMLTFRLTAEQCQRLQMFLGDRLLKESFDIYIAINEQTAQQAEPQPDLEKSGQHPRPTVVS